MISVALLAGGTSSERQVSLRSGAAVQQALSAAGYNVVLLDTDCTDQQLLQNDVVFSVLHGAGGEDGQFQTRLEKLGLPFVGSDAASSRLTFDKHAYRQKLLAARFPIAKGARVDWQTYPLHSLAQKPHVVKPSDGGSSIDTFIIRKPAQSDLLAIEQSFKTHKHMLLEQLIDGIEITVGILGDQPLPVIEIIPPASGEFDYTNKYNGATQELCPPLHVNPQLQEKAQELALQAHQLTGCRDLSRTDMIVQKDGSIIILETNTLPGMTATSLFPKMAQVAGYDMPTLTDCLVKMALSRAETAAA